MSYRITLLLTHIASGSIAGGAGWFAATGQGGVVTCSAAGVAAVVLTGVTCAWWMARGLAKFEDALLAVDSTPRHVGVAEFDGLVDRVRTVLSDQRRAVRDINELLERINPEPSTSRHDSLRSALSRLVRSTAKDVGRIMSFGDDIAQSANDAHWGAQEQARTVTRTVEAVEDLSGKIDLVASNANSASNAASEVSEAANKGLLLVHELIQGMDRIRAKVAVGEKKVLSLGERSQEIGSIVETMTGISSRADILALNASIEAVRAGQEGRGFAVVAEEVRKLAERTAKASREIAALVESIQL